MGGGASQVNWKLFRIGWICHQLKKFTSRLIVMDAKVWIVHGWRATSNLHVREQCEHEGNTAGVTWTHLSSGDGTGWSRDCFQIRDIPRVPIPTSPISHILSHLCLMDTHRPR